MINVSELFWLALLCFAVFHFWRTQGVKAIALRATREYCQAQDLHFLDESIALRGIWVKRDKHGQLRAWRKWVFEFTVTGGERYVGTMITLGQQVVAVNLPPHRYSVDE